MPQGPRAFPRLPALRGLVFALALGSVLPAGAAAQTAQDPVELQETNPFGLGARALGMGNAMIGVADDAGALLWNPAGLAQIRRSELSAGLTHDTRERTTVHFASAAADRNHTRFSHFIGAFPLPGSRNHAVTLGLGYHRWADLDDIAVKEGLLVEPEPDGLYELETFRRKGTLDAWTAAVGFQLTPEFALGGSLRLLTGSYRQDLTLANYRARQDGQDLVLDLGSGSDPDLRTYQLDRSWDADALGVTGSVGFLGTFDSGVRVGAVVDLPATLEWEGDSWSLLEDTMFYYPGPEGEWKYFRNDITLPLSMAAGLSWENEVVLVSGGVRWTDYAQIDYEGEVLAPSNPGSLIRQPAYRSVVAWSLGTEIHPPDMPLRLRAGYFTQPVPYELIAADTDFTFVPDDDGTSTLFRDYPKAEIGGDRDFITVGAGLELEDTFSIDAAFAWGSWSRQTASNYRNSTDFYETRVTKETVDESKFSLSATAHFR